MAKEHKYLFGPVASRRLGRSLGVDIVPLKTCSQNCIYCQLGVSGEQTLKRKPYVPMEAVLSELKEKIAAGLTADYITFSGSGEPTLNSQIGELIDGIKAMTDIPVAVITNGTLLGAPAVRTACAKADVVLPSLDAGDEKTFRKINCPHTDISLAELIEGLCRFRAEFTGQIWLEIFLIEGINTDNEQIERINAIIPRIGPEKVQLNTAVRPVADSSVVQVELDKLQAIAKRLGGGAEVIADFSKVTGSQSSEAKAGNILEMLKRRPCNIDDICTGLGIGRDETLKYLAFLEKKGAITTEIQGGDTFFRAKKI